jgi:hypothetical protein
LAREEVEAVGLADESSSRSSDTEGECVAGGAAQTRFRVRDMRTFANCTAVPALAEQ